MAALRVKTIFAIMQLPPACSLFHAVAATPRARPVHQTLDSIPPSIRGVSTRRGECVTGVALPGFPRFEAQCRGDAGGNAGEKEYRCEAALVRHDALESEQRNDRGVRNRHAEVVECRILLRTLHNAPLFASATLDDAPSSPS